MPFFCIVFPLSSAEIVFYMVKCNLCNLQTRQTATRNSILCYILKVKSLSIFVVVVIFVVAAASVVVFVVVILCKNLHFCAQLLFCAFLHLLLQLLLVFLLLLLSSIALILASCRRRRRRHCGLYGCSDAVECCIFVAGFWAYIVGSCTAFVVTRHCCHILPFRRFVING